MKLTGWCRYFDQKRGGRYYDLNSFSMSKRASKAYWTAETEHMNEPYKTEWRNGATYCKVTVTIEQR